MESGKHDPLRLQTRSSVHTAGRVPVLLISQIITRHLISHQPRATANNRRHRHYCVIRQSPTPDPTQNLVKMKFSVAAPLVALFTAFILALLTLLAGIKHNFMPDTFIGLYKPFPFPNHASCIFDPTHCPHLLTPVSPDL